MDHREQPYRATQLWQEVVCGFRSGMPRGRKRVKMHVYHDCFTGYEGVEWLLSHILSKGLFGEVCRSQVERLMQKFLESEVIREVPGKAAPKAFRESQVYQFVLEAGPLNFVEEKTTSPLGKRSRDYSGTCFTNEYAFLRCDHDEGSVRVKQARPASRLAVFDANSQSSKLSPAVVAGVWKEFTLARLLQLVELPTLDDVLTHDAVDGKHIEQNASIFFRLFRPTHQRKAHAQASTAVTDVPHWVVLAIRCLSKWPDGCSEELVGGMPVYSGFELDVLHSLIKYFASLQEPLISPKLHDLYMAVKVVGGARAADALQLCTLLLSQTNRMRVHRVLRMIHKTASSKTLTLSTAKTNRQVLLEAFSPLVIRPGGRARGSEVDRKKAETLVGFMSDNYQHIFRVPDELKKQVERQLQLIASGHGERPPKVTTAFCSRVSQEQYEREAKTTSVEAIAALLDRIAADKDMSAKEKQQKLKLFQREYPEIYARKFTTQHCTVIASPALR